MIQSVMIVEGYYSPTEVMEDRLVCYEDKLRILEKWSQLYAIQCQVYPDQTETLNARRKEVTDMINQLVKDHMHLHKPELLIDWSHSPVMKFQFDNALKQKSYPIISSSCCEKLCHNSMKFWSAKKYFKLLWPHAWPAAVSQKINITLSHQR